MQASHFIEWKKGSLYFHNQTYYDIAATLSRIYNVNIRVASEELRPMCFTGTLGNNEIKRLPLARGVSNARPVPVPDFQEGGGRVMDLVGWICI